MSAGPSRRALERPVPGVPPRPRPPRPDRWTLSNGLRVLAVRRPSLPQVALRVVLPAGAAADPAGADGLASLVGSLLTEGTEACPGEELNRRLDGLGASLTAQVGHDFAEVDLLLLGETLGEGVDLLAEVLVRPTFPETELERVRAETLDALEARLDEPGNVADDRLAEALFGEDHPYARLPLGTEEGVAATRRAALVDFHRRHYRPGGAVLVVAGDFDPAGLRDLLESAFAGWTGEAERPDYPADPAPPSRGGSPLYVPWPEAMQSEIRIGGPGMRRASEDWVPAAVANYLLGGSTITGRLGANLREDKGWTYGVRSGFAAALRAGGWVVETAVDAEVTDAAIAEITSELTRFLAEPVPADELRRAKDALILSLPRAFETPGRIVSRMATVEVFGLPDDYWDTFPDRVESVGREDVMRVAHAYFDPARLVALAVGPEDARD
jgi:predicted Zn-dependent peptidase